MHVCNIKLYHSFHFNFDSFASKTSQKRLCACGKMPTRAVRVARFCPKKPPGLKGGWGTEEPAGPSQLSWELLRLWRQQAFKVILRYCEDQKGPGQASRCSSLRAQEQVFILWGGATLRWKGIKPQRGFPGDLAFPVWGLSKDAQAAQVTAEG